MTIKQKMPIYAHNTEIQIKILELLTYQTGKNLC